jgi:iron complex outermembrane receptor protein
LLAWEPSGDWMYDARLDSLNLYVKYSHGMKAGHFNAGLTILQPQGATQLLDPVDPEFIDAIEVGFRSSWLQNRLSMNFAFFRYWYSDLQVFDFENEVGALPVQKLLNSDADVLGAELELLARPLPGLMLQLSVGWLDTEFKDFQVTKATTVPRGQGELREFDYSGNPLISAPEWSFSGIAEYTIGLFKLGTLVPHYNVRYRDRVYLDPQKLDPISQKPFWIHNARLSYRTRDGRIEVAGWVDNFMDKRYKIDVFDLSLDNNTILEVWNDPRMYGVTFSFSF